MSVLEANAPGGCAGTWGNGGAGLIHDTLGATVPAAQQMATQTRGTTQQQIGDDAVLLGVDGECLAVGVDMISENIC